MFQNAVQTGCDLKNAMETVEKEVEPKQSDQITMLTSSLMTLTQEKTKMETAYQSEIKKLRVSVLFPLMYEQWDNKVIMIISCV